MKPSQLRALRSIAVERRVVCRQCRQFSIQRSLHQQPAPASSQPSSRPNLPPLNRPAPDRQIAPNRIRKDFVPERLGAPIGFANPPVRTQDWAKIETAGDTYLERNAANRKILAKKYEKSYFRDFRNMDANRGKFYIANQQLYKASAALYFPNLLGRNLSRNHKATTDVLAGRISVVAVYSRKWAEDQVASFLGVKENPGLRQVFKDNEGALQLVEINHEEFRLSSMMLWLFEWNLKRNRSKAQQDEYFIMRGIPQTVKDSIGMMNDKLGYIFLLDEHCKIRWSACADALDEEKASLVKGVQKLLDEKKKKEGTRT
jgi:ATPase complex subunit ATP10